MSSRHLPVRPDHQQLKHQAKDLLRGIHAGDAAALAELQTHHPSPPPAATCKLADAQFALARAYGVASWPRLVLACRLTAAIWRDDLAAVRELVLRHPELLHEDARGVKGNWGPPMSYAANLGRDRIVATLRGLGAEDVQFAFDRAVLQGRIATAKQLFGMGARPAADSMMGPAETQNGAGMKMLLELGAPIGDAEGNRLAPVAMLLQTYCRNPTGKHECLELLAAHGIALPDSPPMAVHRGRIDLLADWLRRDPGLLARTFSPDEIWPRALGCAEDETLALHGAPLAGGTLLHLCVDGDELDLAHWLLEHGADPNARAAVDADGFGGHTALFGCVVSQPFRVGRSSAAMAQLLLARGADRRARASLRKRLRFVEDETWHAYREVSVREWGERFHDQAWVDRQVLAMVSQ
ncbi:MAG: ankyrin repeat domain-containing protein [Planctomycetes bacterium]|nr:ankyrin repeat domain-containing protein [Planctomycetota bacterium]